MLPCGAMRILIGTLISACTGDPGDDGGSDGDAGPVTRFELDLRPLYAQNQDPLDGLDRAELVVDTADGETQRLDLSVPGSGESSSVGGLGALDGATLTFEGYAEDQLRAWGRTAPISIASGAQEEHLLVLETADVAWLPDLPEAAYGGFVAALGEGRFLVGGGLGSTRSGNIKDERPDLYAIDLSRPGSELELEDVGDLPEYAYSEEADDAEPHVGRFGASFTRLGDDGDEWLLAGGSGLLALKDVTTITHHAHVYDAEDGTWTDLDSGDGLVEPRAEHVALANQKGAVIVFGGWKAAISAGQPHGSDLAEIFDPEDRAFKRVDTLADIGSLGPGIADLGNEGTLLCGGAVLNNDYTWTASSSCRIIGVTGEVSGRRPSGFPSRAGVSMVGLPDGTVLATGGAAGSELEYATAGTATDDIWTLRPGSDSWVSTGRMEIARAGHRMIALDDSHVAIVGGSNEWLPGSIPTIGLSCVEVYEVGGGSSMVGSCDSGDASSGLPSRAYMPSVAHDPSWGVLITGGATEGDGTFGQAQAGLSLYVPEK